MQGAGELRCGGVGLEAGNMSLWTSVSRGRSREPEPTPPRVVASTEAPVQAIRGWTETGLVTGVVRGWERASDMLNRRDPVWIEAPRTTLHGTQNSLPVEPDRRVDPFEFDVVLVSAMPAPVAGRSRARRVHKRPFHASILTADTEIEGVIHLFPGNDPEFAHHRLTTLFLPVTEPLVRRRGALVSHPNVDVALVNRYLITSIRQLDWAPGTPVGRA